MSCKHCWDKIEDDKDFHFANGGEVMYKNVKCVYCGEKAQEVWLWHGTKSVRYGEEDDYD